ASAETSVSGAQVSIRGTDLSAVTDATGRARIGPLPKGRYQVSVSVPAFEALGAAPLTVSVDAGNSAVPTPVDLPEVGELLRRLCGSDTSTIGTAILRGVLRDSAGEPQRGAVVQLDFHRVDARHLRTGAVRWVPTQLRTT